MKLKSLFIALMLILALAITPAAFAATANPGPGSPGYEVISIMVGTVSTTYGPVPWFKAPFPYYIIGIQAAARTAPAGSVNVLHNGTSLLTTSVSISTNWIDASLITTPVITDEASISVSYGPSGSNTLYDVVVQMILKRL